MVSINRRVLYGSVYHDVRCLSTDEKPTQDIRNGSTLVEIDTGETYLFDAEAGIWNAVEGTFSAGQLGITI
jgi:hypothetical protein